ncbi:MAG: DNA methyltransferase [Planctomycetota bacterium]
MPGRHVPNARRRPPPKQLMRQCREAEAREALERKWHPRTVFAHELAPLVVHQEAQAEPFHRWLPYRQGFSPKLVRRFLSQGRPSSGPILDPFSGSGTTLIECVRQGRRAVGLETVPSLVFLTAVRLSSRASPGEEIAFPPGIDSWDAALAFAQTPLHRAALLMAAARTVRGDGRPRKNLPPLDALLGECGRTVAQDLAAPLPAGGSILFGDARVLPFCDASLGGILTSPPYLGRYDYTRLTRPMAPLLRGTGAPFDERLHQVRAHRKGRARPGKRGPVHPAVEEAALRLEESGKKKEAGVVRSYFEDLERVVRECARALKAGAPLTAVLAGALFGGVYIACDLVFAEACESAGLAVEEIFEVRAFGAGRRLGSLERVSPHESLLTARKRRG